MKLRIIFLFFAFLSAGCVSVEVCDEGNDSELIARFLTIKDELVVDSTVSALTILGIHEGMEDSLLYNADEASGFMIPLNHGSGFSAYVVTINDLSDTLRIYHQQENYLISYTCGFGTLFTIDRIEHNHVIFTSDTIVSKLVDAAYEDDEEHIRLYL